MNQSIKKPLIGITGASSGIGKATALEFAKAGYPVLLMARRKELMDTLPIENKIVVSLDVRDAAAFKKAIAEGEAKFGPIDLLVNNAGVMPLAKYVEQSEKDKMAMVDINLKGVINGMDAVLPEMVKRQTGTIVNISSVAGRYASIDHAVYNATKFGVLGLTEAVRRENARANVRFTIIEPGIVKTDLLKATHDQAILDDYWANNKILDGGIDAEAVAKTIRFAYELPQEVSLKEIMITHTKQIV